MYKIMAESKDKVIGIHILGEITKKQKKQISETLEEKITAFGNIRLLLVIDPAGVSDHESLLEEMNFVKLFSDKVERLAVVGDRVWEKTWIALFGLFARIPSEYFDRSQIKTAWHWIETS